MSAPAGVGRYTVLRRLGAGGMAEVFEARAHGEAGFSRRVALKRMLPAFADDPSFARMFLDEARIASRLHHANVVAVLDYGVSDEGAAFQVLEYVDGADAGRVLKRAGGALPVDVALHICAEVGRGLEEAHLATDEEGAPLGIVHRDVSPGNVLLGHNGDVKLADFGVAFAHDRAEVTSGGGAKGKTVFMAPEQARGDRVDARADVFALGCTLHALLTGSSPLAREGAVAALLRDEAPALAEGLPDDARAIIAQATQPRRAARFASASAMVSALGDALAARGVRDGRARLRDFLASLPREVTGREAALSPGLGALDALLNAELVLGLEPTAAELPAPAKLAPLAKAPARGRRASLTVTRPMAAVHPTPREATAERAAPAPAPREPDAPAPDAASRAAEPSPKHPERPRLASARVTLEAVPRALAARPREHDEARPAAATPEAPAPSRPRAPRVGLGAALVLAALGATLALAARALREPRTTTDTPRPSASNSLRTSSNNAPSASDSALASSPAAPTAAPAPAPSSASSARPSASAAPEAPPSALASATAAPRPPRARPAEPRPSATHDVPPSAAPAATAATATAATGVLVIGGEGAMRAQVLVDGAARGFAPRTLELPVGPHALELIAPDGRRLGPARIELTAQHTRATPYRHLVNP